MGYVIRLQKTSFNQPVLNLNHIIPGDLVADSVLSSQVEDHVLNRFAPVQMARNFQTRIIDLYPSGFKAVKQDVGFLPGSPG